MHDPMTVAFTINYPWGRRNPFITVWHVDPETDGSDDSCGWFKRARHGNKAVLDKIANDFEFHWDSDHGSWFNADGTPRLSVMGITIGMIYCAAGHHFGASHRKQRRFMRRHLADMLFFAENTIDTLHTSITQRYGDEPREERIRQLAICCYGWVLRHDQKAWQHARWHVHHWRLQVHPWQRLRRRLLTRCAHCGKGFRWRESPVGHGWHRPKTRWFRGEKGLYHEQCSAEVTRASREQKP